MQRVCGQSPLESRVPRLLVELASPPKIHILAEDFKAQVEAQRIAAVIEKLVPELLDLAGSST